MLYAQVEFAALTQALAKPDDGDLKLEYVVEASRQDETPMKARGKDKADSKLLRKRAEDRLVLSTSQLPLALNNSLISKTAKRSLSTAGTQKLVQTETN